MKLPNVTPKRSSFHFPSNSIKHLNIIKALTHYSSGGDVIKLALAKYEEMLNIVGTGAQVFVKAGRTQYRPYSPFKPFTMDGFERFENMGGDDKSTPAAQNFFFAGEVVAQIKAMKAKIGVGTNTDVIRIALTTLRDLVQVGELGEIIVVRDTSGREFKFDPFLRFNLDQLDAEDPVSAEPRVLVGA